MDKIYVISCCTGCTCCSDDNHLRGPYKTREEAQRRIDYFRSPDSKYWPIASQYSRRGNYYIEEITVEKISNNRFILKASKVVNALNFIVVNEDGTVSNNEDECFYF